MLAFGLACTADWAFSVALAVVAFDDAGAAGVGLVALARMLPSALLTPFVAAVADRARRDHVLIAVSVIRFVTIGGAAALLAMSVHHIGVYLLAVMATVAFTIFRPAHSALLPSLCISGSQLTSANVVRGLLESLATLVGPLIAGILLAVGQPASVFVAAAGLSAGAAAALVGVGHEQPVPVGETARRGLGPETMAGVRTVVGNPELLLVFGAGFCQTYVRGALNVFIVVVAFELLDTGEAGVAALSAALGVGGVIGSFGASFLAGSRHLGLWLVAGLVLWGAPIAMVGGVSTASVVFALMAVVGAANALIDIPLFTLPVRLASDAVLARVFGVFESVVALGVALGSVATPTLIALVGLRPALVASGLFLPAVALVAWRRLAALDRRLAVRDADIRVLRSSPMLELLPVPSVEHLASRVRRRVVPAGTLVFEQGSTADSFYVIAHGHAEIVGNGSVVRTVGPGDSFGEIAILHDVPRTATVRAQDDIELFEVDRNTFLDEVANHGVSARAANAVVAGHLARFRPAGLTI